MFLIDNQLALNEICASLSQERIIAIDSEFERRTTYYSKPSILQIVTSKHKIVIDLLVPLNLDPLKQLLLDDRILKILHSPREDFEIFFRLFKILPKNFFDTQIAAKYCGMGESLSYSNLCEQICNVEIEKKHQKSNWLKRPVNPQMLEYAVTDALYLGPIYHFLKKGLEEKNLLQKFDEQMKILADHKNYIINTKDSWKKVGFTNRTMDFTNRMQTLAAFREECASETDVPRRHFLTDQDLVKICTHLPTSDLELKHLHLDKQYSLKSKYKSKLFDLCAGLNELI